MRADVPHVAAAAKALAAGAFHNAGQSCCSVERIYVHHAIAARFTDALVSAVAAMRVGQAHEEGTYIGPLARGAHAASLLHAHVADAVSKGARVAYQTPEASMPPSAPASPGPPRPGAGLPGRGVYFPPTVLVDVDHSMRVMHEESFGPIVAVQVVRCDAEAAALMDDGPYGLTASVWSADEAAALRILRALRTGTGYVNACDRVSPRMPWSGRKDSGVGVTLGLEGLRAFTQPKALHVLPPPT